VSQFQTPTGGSSGEFWTMGESLIQPFRVQDEGPRVVSRCLFLQYRHEPLVLIETFSFCTKAVYNPKAFVLHAEWLDQTCVQDEGLRVVNCFCTERKSSY